MLQEKDYMKQMSAMSEEERAAYFSDVQRWSEDDYPRLESVVDAWTDTEYKIFDEGLKLCTAMSRARPFVGVAYRLTIDRRMKEIRAFMDIIMSQAGGARPTSYPRPGQQQKPQPMRVALAPKAKPDGGKAATGSTTKTPQARRPNHYDEWADRMSAALRQKVGTLSDLYAAMAHYRQMVENLASDPRHSEQDLSRAARLAVEYEKRILAIHRQAEVEWAELNGAQVSDDVKRDNQAAEADAAFAVEKLESKETAKANNASKACKVERGKPVACEDIYVNKDYEKMTYYELQQATELPDGYKIFLVSRRKEVLHHIIRDGRNKVTPKRQAKVLAAARELVDMGCKVTPRMKEVMTILGLDYKELLKEEETGNE